MKTVLEGKRILLTRPENQYSEWAETLGALGAIPISFPLIEILPVLNSPEIGKSLSDFNNYDWIIFTSVNAAKYFIDIIRENNLAVKKQHIAAIGSKTAAYLEQNGLSVDFMPGVYTAAELAESLPDITKRMILLPRTDIADDELFSGLTRRGAKVDEIIVYATKKIINKRDEFQYLINEGLDVVTFASPSVVEAFSEMKIERQKELIACIGPVTAEKVVEKGFNPDIIAQTFTAEGLTQSIMEYYSKK